MLLHHIIVIIIYNNTISWKACSCSQAKIYMSNLTKFWLRYWRLNQIHMIPFFHFHEIWFVGDENNRNLNNLFQKLFCSPSKVPISTRKIFRNSKRSRMFNQLILTENLEISIVFFSIKSIIMKIKEWYHLSLTSNISAKNWSNCTCRGCFENLTTSRFQICPWF